MVVLQVGSHQKENIILFGQQVYDHQDLIQIFLSGQPTDNIKYEVVKYTSYFTDDKNDANKFNQLDKLISNKNGEAYDYVRLYYGDKELFRKKISPIRKFDTPDQSDDVVNEWYETNYDLINRYLGYYAALVADIAFAKMVYGDDNEHLYTITVSDTVNDEEDNWSIEKTIFRKDEIIVSKEDK